MDKYRFDRPVIILAAPRSGSTLLFETLSGSENFWTIGGESHGVFESISQFNPQTGLCNSNALTADDANDETVLQIRASFFSQLRNSRGVRYDEDHAAAGTLPRLLEKTPKNAVRVSLLNKIFPDALYIYLYRNPRENISSMIDAWHSSRFVTYRRLAGRHRPWSMLLPPGWERYHDASIEETAAFQWREANTAVLRELSKLGSDRWTAVSYGQQVNNCEETVTRLCQFCGVLPDAILAKLSSDGLQMSRYTLTRPAPDKWQAKAGVLRELMPGLVDTVRLIQNLAPDLPADEFDLTVDAELATAATEAAVAQQDTTTQRNARCFCGSGKRFKHCHGQLQQPGATV